jgi:flagellar basal-body rod modification protein FlgD
MDNAQMTSQLAQISTVNGIEKLNATLQALMDDSSETQAMQAAALVGHGVLVPGSGMTLQEGMAIAGVELSEPADRVTISINDAHGMPVKVIDLGAKAAGSHSFSWDGTADNGAQAADGRYSLSVSAVRGDAKVNAAALELGVVSSVARGAKGVSLNVGGLGVFSLNDVRQIL